jgi:hypothetical protein
MSKKMTKEELVESIYNQVYTLVKNKNFGIQSFTNEIPNRCKVSGLYFILDPNMPVETSLKQRIVRVGISKGKNMRILLHQKGNSSNSIFRKHILNALIVKEAKANEENVTNYIGNLNYVFLPISDVFLLKKLEKDLIEILSNTNFPQIYPANSTWLGFNIGLTTNSAISQSHLWNVHYTKSFNHLNTNRYLESIDQLGELIV